MRQNQVENHSLAKSIFLHLFPGVLIGIGYFILRKPVQYFGFPSIFSLILSVALILIPVELAYLCYQAKRKTGQRAFLGIIHYRNSIPRWHYFTWVPIIFIVTGVIFTLLKPIEVILQKHVFFWVPTLNMGLDGNYPKTVLMVTYLLFLLFIVFAAPIVEELYFRGYLLPRMKWKLSVVIHSFFFAVYHVFTPWMIITRSIGLLPLIFGVKRKNLYLGMIVHIMANSLDAIVAFIFIYKMTGIKA